MTTYSIKELEKISGVKAHTIRIWEQRYGLLEPKRTNTNIRYYTDNDLKKLLNISFLNEHGWKISKIAVLNDLEVEQRIASHYEDNLNTDLSQKKLLKAMLDMDEEALRSVIKKHIDTEGFRASVESLIYTFLQNIGVMWQIGQINPLREHFASNIIKAIFIEELNRYPNTSKNGTAVLFLPEDELHEIGLLYYAILCRQQNIKTIYLGQNLPLVFLKNYLQQFHPEFLITAFIKPNRKNHFQEIISACNKLAPHSKLYIGGSTAITMKPDLNGDFKLIEKINDFCFV